MKEENKAEQVIDKIFNLLNDLWKFEKWRIVDGNYEVVENETKHQCYNSIFEIENIIREYRDE